MFGPCRIAPWATHRLRRHDDAVAPNDVLGLEKDLLFDRRDRTGLPVPAPEQTYVATTSDEALRQAARACPGPDPGVRGNIRRVPAVLPSKPADA